MLELDIPILCHIGLLSFFLHLAFGALILADEPTGNLDSKNGIEVMELLRELNREGTTVVMVTHSQRDASYADRIINLFDGQIVDSLKERM